MARGTDYSWDAANRMQTMDFLTPGRDNEDVTFTHDNAGQLTVAERSGTAYDEGYTYDDNGNREIVSRSDGVNQDWVISANNRLDSDGTFSYAYDDEGNQKSKTRINTSPIVDDFRTEFTWDHRNRLTKVTFKRNATSGGQSTTDPGQMVVTKTVEYFYDMFNNWTMRDLDPDGNTGAANHTIEQWMHDGQETILHGVPNSPNPWRSYMRGPQQDMVLWESRDTLRIYLGDHLNTIRDVVDTNGNIVKHLTIDSFGRRVDEYPDASLEVFIGLGGRPYDEVTGLQNHHNRWYSVDTGRWMSEDPIGFAGGDANLSRFVSNSPNLLTDPSGLAVVGGMPASAQLTLLRLVQSITSGSGGLLTSRQVAQIKSLIQTFAPLARVSTQDVIDTVNSAHSLNRGYIRQEVFVDAAAPAGPASTAPAPSFGIHGRLITLTQSLLKLMTFAGSFVNQCASATGRMTLCLDGVTRIASATIKILTPGADWPRPLRPFVNHLEAAKHQHAVGLVNHVAYINRFRQDRNLSLIPLNGGDHLQEVRQEINRLKNGLEQLRRCLRTNFTIFPHIRVVLEEIQHRATTFYKVELEPLERPSADQVNARNPRWPRPPR